MGWTNGDIVMDDVVKDMGSRTSGGIMGLVVGIYGGLLTLLTLGPNSSSSSMSNMFTCGDNTCCSSIAEKVRFMVCFLGKNIVVNTQEI
jgi:hypothetical protein